MRSSTAFLLSSGIASLSSAKPVDNGNFEYHTNELGYNTIRFKEGMGPGSEDYEHRFGDKLAARSTSSIHVRDDDWTTTPTVGKTRIAYGCQTNIGDTVFSKIEDICGEDGCDEGSTTEVTVTYPDSGRFQDYTVTLTAEGEWPAGERGHYIDALKSQVMKEAVEIEDVTSHSPSVGHGIGKTVKCPVVYASNFYKVVVRKGEDGPLIGSLDVTLSMNDGDGSICGTVLSASSAIVGAISGIAGGVFGAVQAVACD